jgi:cobalamin-dependent methionine synthase I
MTDCSVMRIEKKAMVEVLHREHAFSDLFVAHLLTRNIREDRIRDLVQKAVATTDEQELQSTIKDLRAALHQHIEQARQMVSASYPHPRPHSSK